MNRLLEPHRMEIEPSFYFIKSYSNVPYGRKSLVDVEFRCKFLTNSDDEIIIVGLLNPYTKEVHRASLYYEEIGPLEVMEYFDFNENRMKGESPQQVKLIEIVIIIFEHYVDIGRITITRPGR